MEWWLRRPNDIRGPCRPKVSRHLSYRWGKTPKKTSPRKPVLIEDRTRARCVTSAHATTCSTAVDQNFIHSFIIVVYHLPYRYILRDSHLKRHDLSGDGIYLWITYILFWPHKEMEGLPGWGISSTPGPPPRQHKHEIRYTPIHTNKANMEWWLRRPNDIRGPCGHKISRHLSYRWGKTLEKTSPRKPVPTWDRTRARCVTSAHATTCSTAVDKVKGVRE